MTEVMKTVGRYEILREIGRGGMAQVFLARQTDLDRFVALKELGAFHASDPSFAQRFIRESRVAGSLSHPNIVTVHDYFEHEGTPYIAMEYVERGSLRPYVGSMTLNQIGGVLEGLLAGLAAGEQHGIVHRDLKPENLMVTSDGRVKIADFGIAKATQGAQAGQQFLTATGTTVGTPTYMAPEQAMAQEVGPYTDLYSVGCMAFEMFTGRPPFGDSEAPMAILLRHVNEPIPPASDVADVDADISGWISRLVIKSPAERTQSATLAWDEFEEIIIGKLGPRWRREARLGEEPGVVVSPSSAPSTPKPLTPAPFDGAGDGAGGDGAAAGTPAPPPAAAPPGPMTPPPMEAPAEATGFVTFGAPKAEPAPETPAPSAPPPAAEPVAPPPEPAADTPAPPPVDTPAPAADTPAPPPPVSGPPPVDTPPPAADPPAPAASGPPAADVPEAAAAPPADAPAEPEAPGTIPHDEDAFSTYVAPPPLRPPTGEPSAPPPATPEPEPAAPEPEPAAPEPAPTAREPEPAAAPPPPPAAPAREAEPEKTVMPDALKAPAPPPPPATRDERRDGGGRGKGAPIAAALGLLATVVVVLLLVLGGGDDAPAPDPEPAAAGTATVEPEPEPTGPDPDYVVALDEALPSVDAAGKEARGDIRAAKTPGGQASAASAAAKDLRASRKELRGLDLSEGDAALNKDLVAALGDTADGWKALAAAARGEKKGAYDRARNRIGRSEKRLGAAVAALADAGYDVDVTTGKKIADMKVVKKKPAKTPAPSGGGGGGSPSGGSATPAPTAVPQAPAPAPTTAPPAPPPSGGGGGSTGGGGSGGGSTGGGGGGGSGGGTVGGSL